MSNPWLNIPLDDYEGHMRQEGVHQLDPLADLFGEALVAIQPKSLAILGIAGGNGLDRVDTRVTRRVVGIDLNPDYLRAVQDRYPDMAGLELHCANLMTEDLDIEPVDLVHCAFVFEHAGLDRCLRNALHLVASGGTLAAVLQLPSASQEGVSPTPFASMHALRDLFQLIPPATFQSQLAAEGWTLQQATERALPSGKGVWMGLFQASA